VRRLPYFDFQEVAAARRLAELLAAGVSPRAIEKKLDLFARCLPDVARPLAQLSVIVQGREILLRQGDGLIEPGGQLRFDFDAWATEKGTGPICVEHRAPTEGWSGRSGKLDLSPSPSPEQMCSLAAELEEDGQLAAATDMYRAAMAAGGPKAEICFLVAELLYRQGDLAGARERYYTAIELDEDYVEARANLGCVLAETGQFDLAVAALEGALRYHPDYADVHYHLARTLDEMNLRDRAEEHWRAFLALTPDSPWAEEARVRLGK
jgi:tetratricopeptide (TPR) repeat protein